MSWRAILLVNLATLLWAGNIVLGRALRGVVGPFQLTLARAVLAALCLSVFMAVTKAFTKTRPNRRDLALLAAMGLTGVLGFQVLQYAGLRLTTAVNAGLVNATNPLITLLLARLMLGQSVGMRQLVGAIVGLAGVAVVIGNGSWETLVALSPNPGDLLVLAAVVCWALYSISGKLLLERHPTLWVTAVSTLFALPILAAPAWLEAVAAPPQLSVSLALSVLYIGVGPGCIAFLAWNEGVRRMGPNGASAFLNTLPFYTAVIATVAIGEVPGAPAFAGGALIIAGCLWATLGSPAKV